MLRALLERGSTKVKCLPTIATQMVGVDGGWRAKAFLRQQELNIWAAGGRWFGQCCLSFPLEMGAQALKVGLEAHMLPVTGVEGGLGVGCTEPALPEMGLK